MAAVTGATSGLGVATAEGLARLGARVRLVVRDAAKGERVRGELASRVPGADFGVDVCDASDLDDVRRFVAESGYDRLDVLVHNAGAMPPTRTESAQGHEMTMALHVLGPVLMTDLLRPALAAAPEGARVVLVTSGGMYGQALRADDPEYRTGEYAPTTAYARSKRAQVELLPVLLRRWADDGTGVDATHPAGRTPRGSRRRCPPSTGSRAPSCATPRAARTRPCGWRAPGPRRPVGCGTTAARVPRTCSAGPAPATRTASSCGSGASRRPGWVRARDAAATRG